MDWLKQIAPTIATALGGPLAGMVHEATTTASKFSGPAGPTIDTFTYQLTMVRKEKIAPGAATLLATIKYKCPEGERVVQYPRHANLSFDLKG